MALDTSSRSARIEKIFEQVEQESERRAHEEGFLGSATHAATVSAATGRRRGGSISVSRFGQSPSNSAETLTSSSNMPRPMSSYVVHKPAFYQAQVHGSADSLASASDPPLSQDPDEIAVTQMAIAGRQSISRAVGGLISRKLSRAKSASRDVFTDAPGVVIGVSVEEATIEAAGHSGEPPVKSVAYAPGTLRHRASQVSLSGDNPDCQSPTGGWTKKAKDLKSRFRRKSLATFPPTNS